MTRRLVAAFIVAALSSVGLLGGLTWATARTEVSALVDVRNDATAREVSVALADAYLQAGGSLARADLRPALTLAMSADATLVVRDRRGSLTPGSLGTSAGTMMGRMHAIGRGPLGQALTVPVVADGVRVGTAELRFPVAAPAAERALRDTLTRTVLWGGATAATLALVVGLLIARRISRPLRRLTSAARRLQAGDRSARVRGADEPAELGELSIAFDAMAEAIEREEELRRAFAADVAHELRTPVTVAQGELEALCDGVVEPTPERLHSLHEEVLRLGRVVEDVETLAAAEAARFRLERRRVDLAEVALTAVNTFRVQAEAAGVSIAASLRAAPVLADRARLEQVLRNLLSNALKFTPPGGCVNVTATPDDGVARLVVEDTGPGVSPGERAHVFERFWRGRTAGATPGSGVGLAVVAELVQAHGGDVDVDEAPAGGARFTVSLPAA